MTLSECNKRFSQLEKFSSREKWSILRLRKKQLRHCFLDFVNNNLQHEAFISNGNFRKEKKLISL